MNSAIKIFGPAALIAVFGSAYTMSVSAEYQDANAIVSSFHSKCYFDSVERGVMVKTTTTTDTLPCADAEILKREHPKYQAMNMHGATYVKFEYISPADNKQYSGELKYGYNKNGLKHLKRNKRFKILAHSEKPHLVRVKN